MRSLRIKALQNKIQLCHTSLLYFNLLFLRFEFLTLFGRLPQMTTWQPQQCLLRFLLLVTNARPSNLDRTVPSATLMARTRGGGTVCADSCLQTWTYRLIRNIFSALVIGHENVELDKLKASEPWYVSAATDSKARKEGQTIEASLVRSTLSNVFAEMVLNRIPVGPSWMLRLAPCASTSNHRGHGGGSPKRGGAPGRFWDCCWSHRCRSWF
jgi:hypothetical protein